MKTQEIKKFIVQNVISNPDALKYIISYTGEISMLEKDLYRREKRSIKAENKLYVDLGRSIQNIEKQILDTIKCSPCYFTYKPISLDGVIRRFAFKDSDDLDITVYTGKDDVDICAIEINGD